MDILEKATDQNTYITANAIVNKLEQEYNKLTQELTVKEALIGKLQADQTAWDDAKAAAAA